MNKSRLISLFCQGLILVCSLIPASVQTAVSAQDAGSQEKQKRAEQVVIRAVEKFGQTLEFNDVYRQMFVKDETLRQEEIEWLLGELVEKNAKEKVFKKVNKSFLERGFVKVNNILWLSMLCVAAEDKWIEGFEQHLINNLNRRQRVFYNRVTSDKREEGFLKSRSDFLNIMSIGDVAEKLLRRRMTSKFRQDLQNKVSISTFSVSTDPPSGTEYESSYKTFYEITPKVNDKWIPLTFTVVEELGAMRILRVMIHVD